MARSSTAYGFCFRPLGYKFKLISKIISTSFSDVYIRYYINIVYGLKNRFDRLGRIL
jgi:hypothetical protein